MHDAVPMDYTEVRNGRTVKYKICENCYAYGDKHQVVPKANKTGWMHVNHGRGTYARGINQSRDR